MLIVALISAVVIVRWSGVHHEALATAALGKLQFTDQHLRRIARSRGRVCRIEFDMAHGRFRKQYEASGTDVAPWETLGRLVAIEDLRIGSETPRSNSPTLSFDSTGMSPTYGLHLVGPGKRECWLVVAGVSGQTTVLTSERSWRAAFDLLKPPSL